MTYIAIQISLYLKVQFFFFWTCVKTRLLGFAGYKDPKLAVLCFEIRQSDALAVVLGRAMCPCDVQGLWFNYEGNELTS